MHLEASSQTYRGRFAPSPTGALHFGSFTTALASYLDARSQHGSWLVRIDNIDPPREKAGAIAHIQDSLQALGLQHDEPLIYQNTRYPAYLDVCIQLIEQDLAYPCYCSRRQLSRHSQYPGFCRRHLSTNEKHQLVSELLADREKVFAGKTTFTLSPQHAAYSIRLNTVDIPLEQLSFMDDLRGPQETPENFGDFIIVRKDRLPSYMLACAFDDMQDKITHIVRGADLMESCFWQRALQFYINDGHMPAIHYAHLPVLLNEFGQKLSKQHHAEEIQLAQKKTLILAALQALGQALSDDLYQQDYHNILQWAEQHWQLSAVGKEDIQLESLSMLRR